MRILERLMKEEAQIVKDKKKARPKFLQKKAHSKSVCKDCKSSYYYDVVRCPICSSSNLEIIKMEVVE